jgi:uncharacterized RDD family membrane protein YckC
MAVGLSVCKLNLERIGWEEAIRRSSVDYVFILLATLGNIITFISTPNENFGVSFFGAIKAFSDNQSTISSIAQSLSNLWFWSEVIVLLFNKKRRALHDFIAGTVVVVKDSLPRGENNSLDDTVT